MYAIINFHETTTLEKDILMHRDVSHDRLQ